MNAVAEVIRTMRLTGGMFLDAEFTAPWCVTSHVEPDDCAAFLPMPRNIVALHYVCSGRLEVAVAGETPLSVGPGEIIALPRNDPHVLGSSLDLEPVAPHGFTEPGADGRLASMRLGGGGEATRIVCGFLGTERLDDPVLRLLPRLLKLKVAEGASGEWIESSFRFAAREFADSSTRSAAVLARLAEALFMDAVRRYLDALDDGDGNACAGMLDPKIASALGLMHEQLRHRWTTEALARRVGLSRSAFADRFTREMGEAPMRYLARQRLRQASERLNETRDSLAVIAFESGYESEAAFSRAFKREFGVPPATWRRNVAQPH
ncbi:MAG TPA: AraC family transcriptional regulator [Woeseiaceae bacterium]|nr:AraC family transcriptional regulator [Woeseiaceae bacterium]